MIRADAKEIPRIFQVIILLKFILFFEIFYFVFYAAVYTDKRYHDIYNLL